MEIEQIANNYQPSQFGIDSVCQSRMLFLVGVTSAGKDTLKKELLKSSDYHLIVTHTTRLPRVNDGELEKDGVDYHFVSFDQMYHLLNDQKMIEVNRFGSNYYGTSLQEFCDANTKNKIALGDIDVHGIKSFFDIAPHSVTAIFVVPPDYETWLYRLHKRYASMDLSSEEWQTRRTLAIAELEHALSVPYYHFVINDNLEKSVSVIHEIIQYGSDVFRYGDDKARLRAADFLDTIKRSI